MRAFSIIASVAALGLLGCEGELFERPDGEGSWILADLFHTRLQNPVDYRLDRAGYDYQGVHGYARLFDHLGAHGYPWTATRSMPLSDELLEGFSVLFINLLHEESPDFEPEEIDAVQRFVQGGGGLFVIADHTNVYRHAERLNPLLEPMGIEVGYHSALDSPDHAVSGSAWILVDELADHPTNDGVELISFQTGGILRGDHGTAFLSAQGFGDYWDEEDEHGFYGNWRHDGDDAIEPRGDGIAVVAAAEYGVGRVFVVGDQNIYGDVWLHFGDNFAHALNGFEWLAGRDRVEQVPLRERPVKGFEIAVELARSDFGAGRQSQDRYYGLFHHLNRHQSVTARATTRLSPMRDALVIPTPRTSFTAQDLADTRAYLQAGRRVVLLLNVAQLTRAAVELLLALAPDFSFTVAGEPADLTGSPTEIAGRFAGREAVPRVEGRGRVEVGPSGCEGADFWPEALSALEVGALQTDAMGEARHVRLDVTSSWGAPLFAAGGVDLARTARIDGGELVVVLQDAMFRNQTLGSQESAPPPSGGEHVVELVYGLLDYLRMPLDCGR